MTGNVEGARLVVNPFCYKCPVCADANGAPSCTSHEGARAITSVGAFQADLALHLGFHNNKQQERNEFSVAHAQSLLDRNIFFTQNATGVCPAPSPTVLPAFPPVNTPGLWTPAFSIVTTRKLLPGEPVTGALGGARLAEAWPTIAAWGRSNLGCSATWLVRGAAYAASGDRRGSGGSLGASAPTPAPGGSLGNTPVGPAGPSALAGAEGAGARAEGALEGDDAN